jgi:hypothetical protein
MRFTVNDSSTDTSELLERNIRTGRLSCVHDSFHKSRSKVLTVGFGGLVVCVLASGSRVRGFELGRSRWIFFCVKNPRHAFLRRGS